MTTVTAGEARALLLRLLAPYPADRALAADALVGAQAAGMPTFGLGMAVRELDRAGNVPGGGPGVFPGASSGSVPAGPAHAVRPGGGLDFPRWEAAAEAAPIRAEGDGAVRVLDGTGLPGFIAMAAAVRIAGEIAGDLGAGVVGARSVTGTGRLGPYVAAQAAAGRIAILVAHAPRTVAPAGGHGPVLGTDPVAYGVPRANGGALVADFATSALTQAALAGHKADSTPLPDGVALGGDGRPTAEAHAVHALLPAGGVLGTLVGLLVESLAGAALDQRDNPRGRGVVAIVLDPSRLGEGTAERVEALCTELAAAGGHVPGAGLKRAGDAEVLEVAGGVWERLRALAVP
ncbi:Ldh family oxidoreductase [Sinosporangium siamense]|uniref:Ldh family oxidoreductase n=1 Tax=Sinosporangium siamense TaxID=1367973 RepID=A0A919VB30_9ACTN|nr:Ldh family oxidoreductase [Sinosporangium siamense]GII97023.1 hypothetical protein Ssi02_72540 [Sinosporangium siamense]